MMTSMFYTYVILFGIRSRKRTPYHDVVIWLFENLIYSLHPKPAAQLQIPPTGS